MSVTVIDRTAGKLVLFLPALDALGALNISIRIESEQTDVVAHFKRLNPNINSGVQNDSGSVKIVLIDSPAAHLEELCSAAIVYPIFSEYDQTASKEQSANEQFWVPLGEQKLLGHFLGDPTSLTDFVRYFRSGHLLRDRCVLITAGPTAEDLDPVRYLTNRSTGKMGVALARAAFISGASVKLIMGPGNASVPAYLQVRRVRSAAQMAEAVLEYFDDCDVYIGAAAVADFTPEQTATEKIKKTAAGLHLPLKRTIDILKTLSERRSKQVLVGFSVETEHVIENSLQKLKRKNLDLIVVNNPKEQGAAFARETNKVVVIEKNGNVYRWPLMRKLDLSFRIMELLAKVIAK